MSPEVETILREGFAAGHSHAEIASRAGLAVGTTRTYMSRAGLVRRHHPRCDAESRRDEFVAMVKEGCSVSEISMRSGLAPATVSKYLGRWGLKTVRGARRSAADDFDREEFVLAWNNAETTKAEMAEQFGVSIKVIDLAARRFEVGPKPKRPPVERAPVERAPHEPRERKARPARRYPTLTGRCGRCGWTYCDHRPGWRTPLRRAA